MNLRFILYLHLPCLVLFSSWGSVSVYNFPEVLVAGDLGTHRRSERFSVMVIQGREKAEAYVMYDENQEKHHEGSLKLNPDHHWTNFSMSGTVTVLIQRLDGVPIRTGTNYPLKKGIQPTIEGGTLRFEVREDQLPLQVWVDVNDSEMDALLIFADPAETDVPVPGDPGTSVIFTTDDNSTVRSKLTGESGTVIFEPGVHRWGNKTGADYPGYRMPLMEGKRIYLPGGAYVVGSLEAVDQGGWKVFGRGVFSAAGMERLPGPSHIPYSFVHSTGEASRDQVIEGITCLAPPHFNLTVRGRVVIDNVKMFGWWHQTDGTVTGDDSVVKNCFFKVMDDFIKVYSDHCIHENNTMFHGANGAPFQFSWSSQNGDYNVMKDTYIVYSVKKPIGKPVHNTTVINARNGGRAGVVTENNTWDGLYLDNGCHALIGLNPRGATYRNFTIQNVELRSGKNAMPQFSPSYFEPDGVYENIRFINLIVDGLKISGTTSEKDRGGKGKLWFRGDGSKLVFE